VASTTLLARRAPAAALSAMLIGVLTFTVSPGATASGFGELTARPSPSAAASQISVDGVARNATTIEALRLPAGPHRVCYSATSGYLAPPCETVEIVDGGTTTLTPSFVTSGVLHVTTEPASSAAQIAVDGVVRDIGAVRIPIATGPHTVCFEDVTGMRSPPCETVDVVAGQTAVVSGTYTEVGTDPGETEPPTAPEPADPQPGEPEVPDDAPPAVHMDLAATVDRASGNAPWSATVTVRSSGSDGRASVGVKVSGSWESSRPARLATNSCVTDTRGLCQLEIVDITTGSGNTATFTVEAATGPEGHLTLKGSTGVTVNRNGSVKTW
jgi:hypothetical protein